MRSIFINFFSHFFFQWIDNPIDKNYDLLKCDIEPLDQESHEYEVIVNYLNATMGDWRKLQLMDVFKVTRESEPARFKACEQIVERKLYVERKLLWHGTNVAVLVAILSTGLRIMPHRYFTIPPKIIKRRKQKERYIF